MNNKKGVALLLTIFIILIMSILLIGFFELMTTETAITRNLRSSTQALYVAEAGLQEGIRYTIDNMLGDSDWSNNNATIYSGISFGNGTYTVELLNGTPDAIDVCSTGTVSGLARVVRQTVTKTGLPTAFTRVLYAGATIDTSGSGLIITGTQQSSATSFPTANFTYYYNLAPPSQRIVKNYTFNSGTTYSGIWYIDGDVTIESNVTVYGTIVSTGRIRGNNRTNVALDSTSPYPVLIANNNIEFTKTSGLTVNGLVYAGADGSGTFNIKDASSVSMSGTIVAADDIDLSKVPSGSITYDSTIQTNPPPGFSGGVGVGTGIAVSIWQEQ